MHVLFNGADTLGNTKLMRSEHSSKVAPKHKPVKSSWALRMFKSDKELRRHARMAHVLHMHTQCMEMWISYIRVLITCATYAHTVHGDVIFTCGCYIHVCG
jgi:hypothetical protein